MKKTWTMLGLLTIAGFLVRLFFWQFEFVINTDGVFYTKLAQSLAAGDFYGFLDAYWSPLYPFLMAFPAFFTSALEFPGRVISLIFGSLITIPVFLFVRQIYGEIEGLTASALVVFSGHYINSAMSVVPDTVYYFLFAWVIYYGWKALSKNRLSSVFILGILLGAGYLTRPEAIGYVPLLAVLLLGGFFENEKTSLKRRGFLVFILVGTFLLIAAPYLLYLCEATGNWTISAKSAQHLIGGNFAETSAFGIPQVPPQTLFDSIKMVFSTLLFNFQKQHRFFSYMFPPLFILFASIGLFGEKWGNLRRKPEIYLILLFLITFIFYLLTVVELRYMLTYLLILFVWTARGVMQFGDWLNANLPEFKLKKPLFAKNLFIFSGFCIVFLFLYSLPTTGIFRNDAQDREFLAREVKTSGLWLKKNVAPKPRVMAFAAQIAFYAEGEHLPFKAETFEELLSQAKAQKAEFIAISERTEKDWIDSKPNSNEVEEVYRDETRIGCKLIIYRLKQQND